ncbi:MAG: LLM class flavin-dependent oxidoreductase [Candidatus Bathyarchaeia archaeon]
MKVKFGLGGLGSSDVQMGIKHAMLAEKSGFDGIWMADHILGANLNSTWVEVWSVLAAIAVKTKRVRLYCGVTDPLRRHPAQTAQTLATLDRISNGRAGIAVGAGESMNLLPFGLDWRTEPLLRLREATEVIKMLLESSPAKPVKYKGKHFQLKDAFLQIEPVQKPRPPVFIGALGPKNRELAGEIADGWCSWLQSLKTLKESIEDIRRGAERAGRNLEDFEIALNVPFAISNDLEEAWKAIQDGVREELVLERRVLNSMGYTDPFKKELAIQWTLPSKESFNRLTEAKKLVPKEAIEAVSAIGDVETCIKKIEERVELGVNWIIVGNYGPNYERTLKIFQKEIIPYFSE